VSLSELEGRNTGLTRGLTRGRAHRLLPTDPGALLWNDGSSDHTEEIVMQAPAPPRTPYI
jgi:hypothetical protein